MVSMSMVDVSGIRMTFRAKAFILLIALFFIFGLVVDRSFISFSIALIVFIACVRGYVALALGAVMRFGIDIPSPIAIDGSYVDVDIAIRNNMFVPVAFLEISIDYSPFIKLAKGSKALLLFIPSKSYIVVKLRFLARVGTHYIGPLNAVVRDPLGLFRSIDVSIGCRGYVKVFPKVSEAEVRKLLLYTRASGLVRSRQRGSGVEFHSLREYREGDDMRRIDWKHFSALQRLFVKDMERETMSYIVFVVDATKDMLSGVYGYTPLDHCSRIVASIARYLALRGDNTMLTIYSEAGLIHTQRFVKGVKGFNVISSILSSIDFSKYVEKNAKYSRSSAITVAINSVISSMPRERVLVFIFTSSGDESYKEALLRNIEKLKTMKCDIYVVMPIITAFEVKGLEPWQQAIYRIKVFDDMKRELEFVKKLRRYGVNVVATGPKHIPQTVISIVEQYRT